MIFSSLIFHSIINTHISRSVMFACCCPKTDPEQQNKNKHLDESLIEKQTKHTEIDIVKTEHLKQGKEDLVKRQIPVNINLQKMNESIEANINGSYHSNSKVVQIVQDEPILQTKSSRNINKLSSFEQTQKIKKKSDIWQEQSGTKILYFSNQKEEEMIFVFKIIAVKTIQNNPLAYALNPFKNSHKIRTKPIDVSLNFIIWNKSIFQTKSALKNLEFDSYIKTIFGVHKKEEDQKGTKTIYQTDEITEIVVMGSNCIRLQIFDKIIISCLNQKDIKQILQFCQNNTEFFQLDDLSKIVFIFPPELSLSEINLILSKLFRKYLISEKIENILKYLGYYVQLVQSEMFEPVIIVKSNLLMCQQQEIYSKQFEIKLELAIGLLMIQINYNNFKAYQKVLDSFFIDMTIIKYLKLIQFIHKEKKEYLNKLEELKLFQTNQIAQIQNSNKIQQKIINLFEKCVIIKHRIKKRMGELFADYRSAQTPIQQSQKKKKEWDDDLRQNDIRVMQLDKNHEEQIQDNCNIFQAIDDYSVDNASLDIIASMEFKQGD